MGTIQDKARRLQQFPATFPIQQGIRIMQIQVNTDNHIEGGETLTSQVEATIEANLGRFREQLTRVEVFLHDENSHKSGTDDKKCVMEARPAGMKPVAVTSTAATIDEAIDSAAEKLEHLLDHTFGKLDQHKGRTSFAGDQDY